MNKLALTVLVALAGLSIEASAEEIIGHVYPNSTTVDTVCDALLLKSDTRCETPDLYMVVAIVTKETETSEGRDIEAVNALVKKEDLTKYVDKNVKATLSHDEHLAHIVEIVK